MGPVAIETRGPFLESPETFRAHFGGHNSVFIFKTKASRGTKFSFPLQHIKNPALQKNRVRVLQMDFRVRKVLGTFEKRAPGRGAGLLTVRDPVPLQTQSVIGEQMQVKRQV